MTQFAEEYGWGLTCRTLKHYHAALGCGWWELAAHILPRAAHTLLRVACTHSGRMRTHECSCQNPQPVLNNLERQTRKSPGTRVSRPLAGSSLTRHTLQEWTSLEPCGKYTFAKNHPHSHFEPGGRRRRRADVLWLYGQDSGKAAGAADGGS